VCPGGTFCYDRGLTAPSNNNCSPGYYCPAGSDDGYAEECPAGYYCPSGVAAPIICPAGKFNPNEV